jgi:hypothetical protein
MRIRLCVKRAFMIASEVASLKARGKDWKGFVDTVVRRSLFLLRFRMSPDAFVIASTNTSVDGASALVLSDVYLCSRLVLLVK